jgi:hypothetical protein
MESFLASSGETLLHRKDLRRVQTLIEERISENEENLA